MGYTCRNYRAAGNTGGHSPGMVLADLYREDGTMYRTAPVADCGSWSAAISYANKKNNELKEAAAMSREIVAAVLTMVTDPTTEEDSNAEDSNDDTGRESGVGGCSDSNDEGEAAVVE